MGYAMRNRDNICYPFEKQRGVGRIRNHLNGMSAEVVLFESTEMAKATGDTLGAAQAKACRVRKILRERYGERIAVY